MRIRTFDELTSPDDRTLHFTSMGLSTGGVLAPASAARFQQDVIAGCDLVEGAPEDTRNSFERLRELHSYGVLFYDAFTIAGDLALFVAELALRERFLAFYNHTIPLTKVNTGEEKPLLAPSFDVLDKALRKGIYKRGDWGVPVEGVKLRAFHGSMSDLFKWARDTALLPGQRSRRRDSFWVDMRNTVAHPHFHRFRPVESARSITDLAELINQLWGTPTPGGRLFPAARERTVQTIAWRPGQTSVGGYESLRFLEEPETWTCVVVRADAQDPNLEAFDAQFERTHNPTELLFGPGSIAEAIEWTKSADVTPDTIEHLDRLFAVQIQDGQASAPRRPEVALGLAPQERDGAWLLVRADHPIDAYGHGGAVAALGPDPSPEALASPINVATTALLDADDWATMADYLREDFGIETACRPPTVRVPSWRWPD